MHVSTLPPVPGFRRAIAAALLVLLPACLAGRALPGADFVRGDVTADGRVNITDPIALLGQLFLGGPAAACLDAADFDDSGRLDIGDAIRGLAHLFHGGPPPSPPFPAAGSDPSPDVLPCAGLEEDDERLAMPALEEAEETMASAAGARTGPPARGAEGSPFPVDARTFSVLAGLKPGDSLLTAPGLAPDVAPGLDGAGLFRALFEGRLPVGGLTARAVDAWAPLGPDGCFRVTPELIDAGSRRVPVPGAPVPGPSVPVGIRRGDVDGNGAVEAADAEALAGCLTGSGSCPTACWDAADADDDGLIGPGDLELIALAAMGEIDLPRPGSRTCGPDPTADRLPECRTGCSPAGGVTLSVEPEVVCGAGDHLVTLTAADREGNQARVRAVITLCERGFPLPGGGLCPGSPARKPLPPEGPLHDSSITCRWISAVDYDPPDLESELRQDVYDSGGGLVGSRHGLPLLATGAMEIRRADRGPGPDHYLYASRLNSSCRMPPTQLSMARGGTLQVRVGIVCVSSDGKIAECGAEAEVEGIYRARVESDTSAGAACRGGTNQVDALAQDEATLTVNSSTIFAKGVSVRTGNTVTTTPSFSREISVGPSGQGLAATATARFGYSESTQDATGRSEDLLDAFAGARDELPLTVSLWARGKVEARAHRRSSLRLKSRTLATGVWLVAKTSCPVDGPLFLSEIMGEEGEKEKVEKKAEDFRKTRLGR